MLNLGEILDIRCVLLDVAAKKQKQIVSALVESIAGAGRIPEAKKFTKLVLEREKRASTGIGRGVAIPHWLGDDIDETVMAFARTTAGVPFDSIDGQPVRLFFLILGPSSRPTEHLQLLSRLSRILHNDECIDRLLSAQSPDEVQSVLEHEEGS